MTRAVVVGSGGQDGRLLCEALSRRGGVVGLDVGTVTQRGLGNVPLPGAVDLTDAACVRTLFERVVPDETYYLAAHHHSSEERPDVAAEVKGCVDVHVLGLLAVIEAIRHAAPDGRLFYAGSSQMFGSPTSPRQTEETPFAPRNPYAITKVAGAHVCAMARERYALHASVGILYNHESPLRGPRFVTQRIARGARQAQRDRGFQLKLGALSAVVDWGYAPDYVEAMQRIVSQPTPDDYVIATGEGHTVLQFVEKAFSHLGLDWRNHVVEDASLVSRSEAVLVGDATKLRSRTGWAPSIGFDDLVRTLVDAAQLPA